MEKLSLRKSIVQNQSKSTNYYEHKRLVNQSENYYYRLRIEESNGHFSYSKIIRLENSNQANPIDFVVFPNPCGKNCYIQLEDYDKEIIKIQI